METRGHGSLSERVDGADDVPVGQEPVLLEPQPLPEHLTAPSAVMISAMAVVALVAIGGLGLADLATSPKSLVSDDAVRPSVITVDVSQAPGFVQPVNPVIASRSEHVFNMLAMPGAEKARLRKKLAESPIRIGAITLWDTVDEDGDQITVTAAGFTQTLTILHKPETFFVPYLPGGSLRISGVHDGGGGITLGAQTTLGKLPLPYMDVGQVIEVALP